jgi:hypothetical protein
MMEKKTVVIFMMLMFVICSLAFSQPNLYSDESKFTIKEDGRYVLRIMNGRALQNNRIPALVLDQVRGIVWTCQNLQDGKPLWVKADLGRNGDTPLTRKKYVVKMLEWQDADLRMPAIVLDIDEGVTWTCQNIIDGKAMWIQTDLKSGEEREVSRESLGIIKAD